MLRDLVGGMYITLVINEDNSITGVPYGVIQSPVQSDSRGLALPGVDKNSPILEQRKLWEGERIPILSDKRPAGEGDFSGTNPFQENTLRSQVANPDDAVNEHARIHRSAAQECWSEQLQLIQLPVRPHRVAGRYGSQRRPTACG